MFLIVRALARLEPIWLISFGQNSVEAIVNFIQICEFVDFRAMQKHMNRVDLEKCRKMSSCLQNSAPIQPRASEELHLRT